MLDNLVEIYRRQGSYARAKSYCERALAIFEQAYGKSHPDVAATLMNLAILYQKQRLHARAEPLLQRALAIFEQAYGKNHPRVAQALDNLASLYYDQGAYAKVESLLESALAIREQVLGNKHPDVAASLNKLALLRLVEHRLADALPFLIQAFSISERRLRQEALSFSSGRLTQFLQYLRADEERLYALMRAYPDNEDVRRLALNATLLLKGRSAEELAGTSRTIYRGLEAEDRSVFQKLRGLRSRLATLSFQEPSASSVASYQQRLEELIAQGDVLEAELAKRSARLRALAELPSPSEIVNQVAAALPNDGALVEFIAYEDRPFLAKHGMPVLKRPAQLRYLALVLFPNATTRVLDLGLAKSIDRAALSLSQALAHEDDAVQARAQTLYKRAFQPLLPLLGDTRRLFLSLDGQLGLVPFSALHDGQQFLIDSYDFTYLTSGRDLLPRPLGTTSSDSVVVLADPDFSAPSQMAASSSEDMPQRAVPSSVERLFSRLRAGMADSIWEPLPGTRHEAQAIQRLIPHAKVFLGPDATKQRLLQEHIPSVLHIATHGFFLEDEPVLGTEPVPKVSRVSAQFGALAKGPPVQHLPDPLLRSGLVLAGAHRLRYLSSLVLRRRNSRVLW